ncbi:NADH-dependent flavin reductase [Corynebacterium ciconiae DSM 44920]|uniref:flavin reductase family protein n=1 Tax=Corynebacterium ciconiae TaxID=227319 RepID=UPI00036BBBA1|nr:flavin reductase family protein [Corynebacterium ciconiae]WKD60077.1 NADH-dependent flavin reductase [Corynebacterium ciconiae DSM 44920]
MSVTTSVSIAALKDAVGSFPSGVTVLSTHDEGADYAMTISAFCSLSLDPPMVLVCVDNNSRTLQHVAPGSRVGISVLATEHSHVALHFARYGADRFEEVEHRRIDGIPFVEGAASYLSGTVEAWLDGGDHRILTIRVEDCDSDLDTTPLHYERGVLEGL